MACTPIPASETRRTMDGLPFCPAYDGRWLSADQISENAIFGIFLKYPRDHHAFCGMSERIDWSHLSLAAPLGRWKFPITSTASKMHFISDRTPTYQHSQQPDDRGGWQRARHHCSELPRSGAENWKRPRNANACQVGYVFRIEAEKTQQRVPIHRNVKFVFVQPIVIAKPAEAWRPR